MIGKPFGPGGRWKRRFRVSVKDVWRMRTITEIAQTETAVSDAITMKFTGGTVGVHDPRVPFCRQRDH